MVLVSNRLFSTSEFDVITQKLMLNNTIIGFIDGHTFSNTITNPIWVILENTNSKEYVYYLKL